MGQKKPNISKLFKKVSDGVTLKKLLLLFVGAAICSFGIHNIHNRVGITEGGVIGLMLLFENFLSISPAYITPVLDIICYASAFKLLGFEFIKLSAISTFFVSCFYKLWEAFPYVLPDLTRYPLIAALSGGVFVGVGVGIIIRQGGSSGGDDALALTLSHVFKLKLSFAYLFTDVTVLLLSLTYIPITRIGYSLVTVTVSSLLIDFIKSFRFSEKKALSKHGEKHADGDKNATDN